MYDKLFTLHVRCLHTHYRTICFKSIFEPEHLDTLLIKIPHKYIQYVENKWISEWMNGSCGWNVFFVLFCFDIMIMDVSFHHLSHQIWFNHVLQRFQCFGICLQSINCSVSISIKCSSKQLTEDQCHKWFFKYRKWAPILFFT